MSSNLESQFISSLASTQDALYTPASGLTDLQTTLDAIWAAASGSSTNADTNMGTAINNLFSSGTVTATSISSFFDQVVTHAGLTVTPAVTSAINAAVAAFQTQFNSDLLLGTSLSPSIESNILTSVTNPTSALNPNPPPPTTISQADYLNDAFAQFIDNYKALQYNPSLTTSSFLNNWSTFTGVTATVTNQPDVLQGSLPSYEAIYHQAFGVSPPVSFTSFMQTFINNEVATKGYFLPSQSLPDFNLMVVDIVGHATPASFVPAGNATLTSEVTSLEAANKNYSIIAGTNSSKVRVLVTVLIQLVNMLDTLQSTGIQQSNLLNFYTNWQSAYTESANNVPIETQNHFGGDASQSQSYDQYAAAVAQNLRDTRDLIGDKAKTIESDVNNTNQAVQQASSLGTSILQQLSTIMQSLFR